METGTASRTARSVAARRLDYARVTAGYGDPAADETLSRDVAGGQAPRPGRMHEYLRARTAFFDQVVTESLDRGVNQVVVGGAGYDGRALRYAKPGVRWFEVDHPATQADKRARLARLGLEAAHVRFVPAGFTEDLVAGPLLAAGLDPAAATLFLFEGVAVYLTRPVTERVLAGFRTVAGDGSTLAISVAVGDPDEPARARFRERVPALGEQARTMLPADAAAGLLADAGWEIGGTSGRRQSVGLLRATAAAGGAEAAAVVLAAAVRSQPATADERSQPATTTVGGRPAPVSAREAAALPLSALLSQALVGWRARFGDDVIAAVRRSLEPLAAGDPPPLFAGLEPHPDNWRAKTRPLTVLPHFPMTLHRGGYPDGS